MGNPSQTVRRVIGESLKDKPLPVIEASRPVTYLMCPHCKTEIYEKHTYIEGDIMAEHTTRHSDCGGAIQMPPPSPEALAWLDKFKTR